MSPPSPVAFPWFPGKDIRHAVAITRGNHLPHWTMERAVYHVCFRLADSLPQENSVFPISSATASEWIPFRARFLDRAV